MHRSPFILRWSYPASQTRPSPHPIPGRYRVWFLEVLSPITESDDTKSEEQIDLSAVFNALSCSVPRGRFGKPPAFSRGSQRHRGDKRKAQQHVVWARSNGVWLSPLRTEKSSCTLHLHSSRLSENASWTQIMPNKKSDESSAG